MRSTAIWSFLTLVTLATGGLISGCDSDAKLTKSAKGESCDKTADCNDGLKCIDHVCGTSAPSGGGDQAGAGPGEGGSSNVGGPTGPVLSGEGESCTKTADCDANLICFEQTCVAALGEGGGGNAPAPRVGQLGEVCNVAADCAEDLSCIPGGYVYGQGVPVGFIGVCGYKSGSLPPTGKTCDAECAEAADCAELPLELHVPYTVGTPWGTGAESCADLAVQLEGITCASATAANGAKCFAQAAYCNGAKSWACEAGRCNYIAKCTKDGAVVGGCPSYTRSGKPTVTLCNLDGLCAPDAVDPICAKDADCEAEFMADLGVACEADECVCYKPTGGCYRRCDADLDCKPGQTCDTTTSVCVAAPVCTTDQQCAVKMGNARFKCVEEMCQMGCTSDYDCNGGSITSITSLVCAPDHICRAIGCSEDVDCSSAAALTGVKMYCSTPEPVDAGAIVNSAITD